MQRGVHHETRELLERVLGRPADYRDERDVQNPRRPVAEWYQPPEAAVLVAGIQAARTDPYRLSNVK